MKIPLAAIDTEATGTDTFHGCKPYLVTACDGKYNYLWEGSVNPQTREVTWDAAELLSLQLFINSCTEVVFQNGNFDIRMLESIGIYIPQAIKHDTLVASHLVCSGDLHGLKECSIKYLGLFNDDELELEKSIVSIRGQLGYSNPTNIAYAKVGHPHFPADTKTSWKQDMWLDMRLCKKYGTIDGERTYLLHKAYLAYLHQNNLYSQYLQRIKTLPILYRMQTIGINLYINKVDRLIKEFELQQTQLVQLIKSSANCPYNIDPAKPDDLKLLLYHILKLEVLGYTDGGSPSTDEGTLNKLEKKYDNIDTIRYLKGWRKITKVLTDVKAYKIHASVDGRIHSTLNLTGTKWTRLSSKEPNQQNFNKKLDFLFGPRKGYYWLYMDVVNIELRIWAYDVGAKSLIESFEKCDSVHMIIAHALYPEMIAKLGETEFKNTKMYTKCKGGTFTRLNGGGKRKVEETYGVPNSCAIIDEKCPEIGQYFKDLDAVCSGNVDKFNYPTMFTRTGYKLEVPLDKPYTVLSARIQGTAGHMVQQMMQDLVVNETYKNPLYGSHAPLNYRHLDFPKNSPYGPPSCEMIQQVHDSLKIEIPCHPHSDITNKLLVRVTELAGQRTIPTCPMDYEVIECHEDEEPIFRDYTFIPRIESGYEIEMYMHNHQYMCIATYDKDTMLKRYAPTKQQAYELILSDIQEEIPF